MMNNELKNKTSYEIYDSLQSSLKMNYNNYYAYLMNYEKFKELAL